MDKYAAEKIASDYYNMGMQLALSNAGLVKTAGPVDKLMKALGSNKKMVAGGVGGAGGLAALMALAKGGGGHMHQLAPATQSGWEALLSKATTGAAGAKVPGISASSGLSMEPVKAIAKTLSEAGAGVPKVPGISL